MRLAKTLAAVLFMAILPAMEGAVQPRPPWMQPDVVRAAVDIGMNEEQTGAVSQPCGGIHGWADESVERSDASPQTSPT